jgi:hypothetical protein
MAAVPVRILFLERGVEGVIDHKLRMLFWALDCTGLESNLPKHLKRVKLYISFSHLQNGSINFILEDYNQSCRPEVQFLGGSNMSGPVTHPKMPNKETSHGEGQRQVVYYVTQAATGRCKESPSAIFGVQT